MRALHTTPKSRRSHLVFSDRPFQGEGASLYVTIGTRVVYRALRSIGGRIAEMGTFSLGGDVAKTTRVASGSSPLTSLSVAVDTDWHSETIAVDVRRFKDDVENTTDNYRVGKITLDSGGAEVNTIYGSATALSVEQRDGGVCLIGIVFEQSPEGLQALTLTAIRTAGPTSPADVVLAADPGRQTYYFETPALSDASAYTYKIQAANGAVTVDVLTGLSVTADATGPTAPASGSGVAW